MSVSQSAGDVAFAVTLDGVDRVEADFQRLAVAAQRTGKAAETSGGLFNKFEGATRRLDDAVDSVEKPMRALNGALDIASVALGVGLAGPLGTVIGQLIDFGKAAFEAAKSSDLFANRAGSLRSAIESVGKAAQTSEDDVKALYATIGAGPGGEGASSARRVQIEGVGLQVGALQGDIEALKIELRSLIAQREDATERLRVARSTLKDVGAIFDLAQSAGVPTTTIIERLRADISTLETTLPDIAAKIGGTTSTLEAQERALQKTRDDARKSLGAKTEAEAKAASAAAATAAATQTATTASVARAKAVEAETSSLDGLRKALEAIDPLVSRAGAEARASRLGRGVEAGTVSVTDGLFPSQARSVQDVLGMSAEDLASEFEDVDRMLEERRRRNEARAKEGLDTARLASDLAGNGAAQFDSLTKSAMDLGSLGVSALQSFTQAAGASLASLIIDGGKAGKSFSKLAGEVAAGLSAQAFAYSLFLGAAAAISAVTGGVVLPGWNPVQLGTAAAIMGGVGVALAGTARALGAGSSGRSGSTGSSAVSGGGADRVASLSSARPASQPTQVTVILGVDEVSNVLVRQSQRDARAGGLTTSRLAVA